MRQDGVLSSVAESEPFRAIIFAILPPPIISPHPHPSSLSKIRPKMRVRTQLC